MESPPPQDGEVAPEVEEKFEVRTEAMQSEENEPSTSECGREESSPPVKATGKGKGSKRGGKKENGRNSSSKKTETIKAAGLPSMKRMKSQPGRNRGGGERQEEEVLEQKSEPILQESIPTERASGDVIAAWTAWGKEWLQKQEPTILATRDYLLQLRAKIELRVKQHWPLVRAWLLLITRVMVMLSLLGLEGAIRGFASLFRLGSAAHFLLLWCSILNFIRLSGLFNFIVVLGLAAGAIFFVGYTPAFALLGLFGAAVLWLYGSFWTTGAIIIFGGALLAANQGRIAVLVTMLYAAYTMKCQGGWLGLLFTHALAFVSSDLALYFLSTVEKEEKFSQTKAEYVPPFQQKSSFNGRSSSDGSVPDSFDSARSSAGASTSGVNEGDPLSAEEEVARVLGCNDHYGVLGFARYEIFDVSSLKREYRKKAMLVHPDKNGGNDQAEEAFKRLQNAYEVLLDSTKKITYDEDLRREDLGRHLHGKDCGCKHSEDDGDEDLPAGSRRILCRKCGNNHAWIFTNKTKLRARWCQECQDHHPAKDGDGWIEQTGQAFFFGIFQKIDLPHAYACADGNVYEVTEWVLCQGLKFPPNTHKPTFHVSTSGIGKSPTRPARPPKFPDGTPFPEGFAFPNEKMTEQEFFEWLQNQMSAGNFGDLNNGGVPKGSPSPSKPGSATKTRSKKKKGKKQW